MMLRPELTWRLSGPAPELPREVARRLEAKLLGNGRHRQMRRDEKLLRQLECLLADVLPR
ncbi:hypothetical protein D3C72_2512390 [compost metagenome]